MRSYLSDGINHASSTSWQSQPRVFNFFVLEMLSCPANKKMLDKFFNIVNKIDYIILDTFFLKSFGQLEDNIYFLALTFWKLDIYSSL